MKKLLREQIDNLAAQVMTLNTNVIRLTETNKLMAQDLVIVRGAGRTSTEQVKSKVEQPDPLWQPDVREFNEESDRQYVAQQMKDTEDLRAIVSKGLAELAAEIDTSHVTPELVAAVTPTSKEEWDKEHAS